MDELYIMIGCVHRQNCLEEEGIRIWLQKLQKIDHTVLQNLWVILNCSTVF